MWQPCELLYTCYLLTVVDLGVNRLAGFELNKERLFAAGLLSLCFRLLAGGCTDDEILVASQTFWILSFNCVVRTEVKSNSHYMQGQSVVITFAPVDFAFQSDVC